MSYAEKLQRHIDRYKVPQSKVAKSLGKSRTMVNLYLKGKYHADISEMDEIVGAYLKREAKRLKYGADHYRAAGNRLRRVPKRRDLRPRRFG